METNIISRPAIIVVPSVSQFAPGSINLVPLTSKLLAIFSADFLAKSFVQVCVWINQLCVRGKWQCRRRPSFSGLFQLRSLKPQIVEISQNLLLMLLPNAFSLPAGQKSTSEITLLFWRRDEDARSQTISPVTSSRPGRHGRPRDHEWCREKAMKASFSQDSQRRLAADG